MDLTEARTKPTSKACRPWQPGQFRPHPVRFNHGRYPHKGSVDAVKEASHNAPLWHGNTTQRWTSRVYAAAPRHAVSKGDEGVLDVGALVDFNKDENHYLGIVCDRDGKKNWWVQDQNGRRVSVPANRIMWVAPGRGYGGGDVEEFLRAAQEADLSWLDLAYEIAVEDRKCYGLPDLSDIIYNDATPRSLFATYRLMLADRQYFKQVGKSPPTFEVKSDEAVAAAREKLAQEQVEAQDRADFVQLVRAARQMPRGSQPTWQSWLTGPQAKKITALRALALDQALPKDSLALVTTAMSDLGLQAGPAEAWALLVDLGLYRLHEPRALVRQGLLGGGVDEAEEKEPEVEEELVDPDAANREDLTHLRVLTIDDAGTKEVDDGLSLEELPGGGVRLWVHVADPTRSLRPGGPLDLAARKRTRTLYLPWTNITMFPKALAEGGFSLLPGGVRPALSVGASLGPDGSLVDPKVVPSLVRVTHCLTYQQADHQIALGPDADPPELAQLFLMSRLRQEWRASNGSTDIPSVDLVVKVPEEDLDVSRPRVSLSGIKSQQSASRQMVAEMMILAGEAVGVLGSEAGLPLTYRGQPTPELPEEATLAALPEGLCRGYALRRCMTRSTMSSSPVAHAGLGLDVYVQFTSPIRRYSEVIAHFNMKSWLRGETPPFTAQDIDAILRAQGETQRELSRAEKEVEQYWVAEYMRQQADRTWEGILLGWFKEEHQLASVMLEEVGVEVIVRVDFPASPGDVLVVTCGEAHVRDGWCRYDVLGVRGRADERQQDTRGQEAEGADVQLVEA